MTEEEIAALREKLARLEKHMVCSMCEKPAVVSVPQKEGPPLGFCHTHLGYKDLNPEEVKKRQKPTS